MRTHFIRKMINTVLTADWYLLKINMFWRSPCPHGYRKWRKWKELGGPGPHPAWLKNPYIPASERAAIRAALKGKVIDENR